jgi:hypothetical protein
MRNERKYCVNTSKLFHKRALCLGPCIILFLSNSNAIEQRNRKRRDEKSRALGREANSAIIEKGKWSPTSTPMFVETKF